jgi:AI-2 transport protein TqsA
MLADSRDDSSIRRVAFILLTLAIIIVGLVYGRPFLVPIVIAILITILVGAGADRLKRLGLPEPLATLSAVLILLIGIALVFNVLAAQTDAVTQAWPRYIERLNIMADQLLRWAGPRLASKVNEALANLDLMRQVPGLVGSAGGFLVNVLLVTIYVGFLLAERGRLSGKIDLLFSNTEHASEMQRGIASISESIRRYLWIKTIMSLLTSAVSYAVLRAIGVDFAETWALIIFFLNYIPSIGAIIGVAFPALLALVQFDTLWQFFTIAALLAGAQLVIGNVIEPSLMGRTLNLSPFIVMASLAFWAMIWGIVGAFLSIPLTTSLIIVCGHIPSLRWGAVLLSAESRMMLETLPLRENTRAPEEGL